MALVIEAGIPPDQRFYCTNEACARMYAVDFDEVSGSSEARTNLVGRSQRATRSAERASGTISARERARFSGTSERGQLWSERASEENFGASE
jgi:hypothetical protein